MVIKMEPNGPIGIQVPDRNQNEHVGSFQIISNKSGWCWQRQVAYREGFMLHKANPSGSDWM